MSKGFDVVVLIKVSFWSYEDLFIIWLQCLWKVEKTFLVIFQMVVFYWYQRDSHHQNKKTNEHHETSKVWLRNSHVWKDLADGMAWQLPFILSLHGEQHVIENLPIAKLPESEG